MSNTMKKTLLAVLTVIAGLGLCSGNAYAATPADAEVEAFRLYKEAQPLMDQSNWDQAIEVLDRAWASFPMPQIAFKKAKCLQFKGELKKALTLLESIKTDDPKLKGKIDVTIEDIKREVVKPVMVDVKSDADQIRLVVDGQTVFFVPGRITVTQGTHKLEYSAPGYKGKVEERTFTGPGEQTMTVTLEPVGGKVVLKTNLDSFFGVVVTIDNTEYMPSGSSITPNKASPVDVGAGRHTFTCAKTGMPDYSGEFTVATAQIVEVECLLAPVKAIVKKTNPWKWVFFGVGTGIALGGAGLTGWYYWYKENAPRNPGDVLKDNYEGPIGIGISAVGIAMAVMGFFIFKDKVVDGTEKPQKTTYGFALTPVPEGAAAAFTVNFR